MPADMLGEFLHAYGRTLADLNIAISIPTDASRADTFCIAFRVKGADATELAATLATISGLEAVTATGGGKQVQVFRETGGMDFDLYIKGDVVFYVFTDGSPLADEIVAALPSLVGRRGGQFAEETEPRASRRRRDMNARGTAGRLAVGLASMTLVAGCAFGATPTPVPATPTPTTPSASLTVIATPTPTAAPARDLRAGDPGHRHRSVPA